MPTLCWRWRSYSNRRRGTKDVWGGRCEADLCLCDVVFSVFQLHNSGVVLVQVTAFVWKDKVVAFVWRQRKVISVERLASVREGHDHLIVIDVAVVFYESFAGVINGRAPIRNESNTGHIQCQSLMPCKSLAKNDIKAMLTLLLCRWPESKLYR